MGVSPKLVALLSLLPPIAALAGTYAALASYDPPTSEEENRVNSNAGKVLNGRKLRGGVVPEMERLMATHEPQVLILGNSFANTNLSNPQIAWSLGLRPDKVQTMSVPNSVTSHWFAILQHRVYDDGFQVPLVVIVGGIRSLLMIEPYSDASYEDLMVQLEPREPVLGRYMDLSHPELRKVVRNRLLFRDIALNTLRDSAVDLFFEGGTDVTTQALEELFSDENMDMSRHVAANGQGIEDNDDSVEGLPTPKESLIEELCRMIQANGSKLVFVRTPMKRHTPEERSDNVPEQTTREVEAIFKRYGHVYLDLYNMDLPFYAYKNMRHFSPEGARLFTAEVSKTLVEVWGQDHRTLRGRFGGGEPALGGGRFGGGEPAFGGGRFGGGAAADEGSLLFGGARWRGRRGR